jgi:hypothetical protein
MAESPNLKIATSAEHQGMEGKQLEAELRGKVDNSVGV